MFGRNRRSGWKEKGSQGMPGEPIFESRNDMTWGRGYQQDFHTSTKRFVVCLNYRLTRKWKGNKGKKNKFFI